MLHVSPKSAIRSLTTMRLKFSTLVLLACAFIVPIGLKPRNGQPNCLKSTTAATS